MAESTDAQHGHEVAGSSAAVAQRVESGDAGAEQRSGFDIAETFRHGS